MRQLFTDDLDEYPSLEPLFREAVEKNGLTATELDKFLTFMESGAALPETPRIIADDMYSLHGDAVVVFGDLIRYACVTGLDGYCLRCGIMHTQ